MRVDLHVHSRYSPDSRSDPKALVRRARAAGLHGLAITDHNSLRAAETARDAAKGEGILLIPAMEVSTAEGHVLAYGVREEVPRGLSAAETVERVQAVGGVAVAAHPYRFWSGLGERATVSAPFAAYETVNARTLRRGNRAAQRLAAGQRKGGTGGSDAHARTELGRAYTEFAAEMDRVDQLLEELRRGRVSAAGENRGAGQTARYVTKCVTEWMLRGMRRI